VLQAQSVRELVEDRVCDELVLGVLEDEPDPPRQRAQVGARDVGARDVTCPRGTGTTPAIDCSSGLSRAVRADDRDELAGVHVEVDAVQDLGPAAAGAQPGTRISGSYQSG
jgi:hypothetical protein